MSITLHAYAKINITLDVTGRRQDGYHTVCMVMQPVSLFDEITLTPNASGKISASANLGFLPTDGRNAAVKAAGIFFKFTGIKSGIHIDLKKRIPVSAGLGGGSADAAAVLKGMNGLFQTGLSPQQLAALGLEVGADVPFCLYGKTALAEGIGESLTSLEPMPPCSVLLCKPPVSISTERAYKQLDATHIVRRPDTQGVIRALAQQDLSGVARRMYNVMEDQAAASHRSIGEIKRQMIALGAVGSVMSGSGPTVFGIFDDTQRAGQAYEVLSKQYIDTFLCTNTIQV